MSLKDTINNTNTQKENTKKVATQIDNKLVALGGERATDLFDVANKIPKMVSDNYQKVAILTPNERIVVTETVINKKIDINVPFEIGMFFVKVYIHSGSSAYGECIFSYDDRVGYLYYFKPVRVSVIEVTKNSITLKLDSTYGRGVFEIKEIYAIEKKVV